MQPEPGLCCQEGCESCVWLVYATELLDFYRQKYPTDTLNRVKEEIGDKIESPSVREYVMMELAMADKRFRDMMSVKKKKKPED
uniref:Oxidoreductase-like domain-containing protein n=1 Tax=Caenorhabditis japonica TaxID=281687 RepID=A0A8R1DL13_CAEJA